MQNHRWSASDAARTGFATFQAQGNNLRTVTVHVTITTPAGASIIVPAGTRFESSAAGTQSMISAVSLRFAFAPAPQDDGRLSSFQPGRRILEFLERGNPVGAAYAAGREPVRTAMFSPSSGPRTFSGTVPAFCINRWREVPGAQSQLAVTFPGEQDPLYKLASCLEASPAKHRLKQSAVWMISDNLIDLSVEQLEGRIFEEIKSKAQRATGAELADFLKEMNPAVDEDSLRQIRNLPRDQVDQLSSMIQRKIAQEEARQYAEAGPLLQECGYDVSNSPFFRK